MQVKDTRINFHVVTNTDVYGLRLVTCDARQSALSLGFAVGCNCWCAPHADPQHIQSLERIIPMLLIGSPVKCQIVEEHIDPAVGKRSHGGLESRIERHEQFPPNDDAFVYRQPVSVVDQPRRQGPYQEIDAEEQPGV